MNNTLFTTIFTEFNKKRAGILAALAIGGLGLFLYFPTVNLLLFWDDIPHMQWLASQANGAYWLTSEGFPFYRPSTFAVWDGLYRIYGYHNPQALHSLSIALHLGNAGLVALLATKLTQNRHIGLSSGLIFVAFPFSYQTVIPTPAHFHLWLVFGILSSAWLLITWSESQKPWQFVAAILFAFWAIFSHENGVLAPILIGGIVAVYQRRYFVRVTAAITPLALLYGLIWMTVPKANEANGLQLAALDAKLAQTMQAIGFPLAALLQQLFTPTTNDTNFAWLSGGLALLGIFVALYQDKTKILLTLTWVPIVMLPAWLLLDVNYLLGSPRLHYLASVGIAWLWGSFLGQKQWGSIGVGLFLLVAVPFIRDRVKEHQQIDAIYQEVGQISLQANSSLLLINGPAFLAPSQPTFLVGAEGSTYLPDFVRLQDWLALNRFQNAIQADNHRATDIIPAINQQFFVGHSEVDRTQIRHYERLVTVIELGGELHSVLVGEQLASTSDRPLADFGNGILLETATFSPQTHYLQLSLNWHLLQVPPTELAIFVHLLCDGHLIDQADGPPLGKVYPFSLWQNDEQWRDYRYFAQSSAPCLQAFVGLFDPRTNTRVPVIGGNQVEGILISLAPPQ